MLLGQKVVFTIVIHMIVDHFNNLLPFFHITITIAIRPSRCAPERPSSRLAWAPPRLAALALTLTWQPSL